ncbi:glycoside hydrolase superfamily [Gautieria morchelliformis]|nr:glycoside hydrolase superfamily [Gautieria morchelliformis]
MLQALWLLVFAAGWNYVLCFDNSRNDNLAVYWGQNSYGVTHPSDTANAQKTLSFYCADNTVDVFPLAFLDNFFDTGGLPHIDLSNICSTANNPVFNGTNLVNCQFLASDIQTCQSKGKIVTLSMGGGAAGGTIFSSASQATSFADQIWNLFLGGSSSTRPFGAAVLDGVDLDIEGGSTVYYDSFINQIRSHAAGASKPYYITAAPQCPFPDAYLGTVLNAAPFDAVYPQFYNNYCSLPNYNNPQDWDFSQWDNWAKNTAINKNVKVYIGAPASTTAANAGSYVDSATLGTIIQQTRATYSSFGGVMMWDESQAYANGRYDVAVKASLTSGGSVTTPSSSGTITASTPTSSSSLSSSTSLTPPPTTSTPASSGSCAGVAAWSSAIAYTAGQQVVYNGHLWTAKWWTQADAPGGAAGDWTDDGACTTPVAAVTDAAMASPSNHVIATVATTGHASVISAPGKASPAAKANNTKPIASQRPQNSTTPSNRSRWFRL